MAFSFFGEGVREGAVAVGVGVVGLWLLLEVGWRGGGGGREAERRRGRTLSRHEERLAAS